MRSLIKTFNVRGPSYLCLTRSISWLLMRWLLAAPGHQQTMILNKLTKAVYCKKKVSPAPIRRKISTMYSASVWKNYIKYNDIKYKKVFMFPLQNL